MSDLELEVDVVEEPVDGDVPVGVEVGTVSKNELTTRGIATSAQPVCELDVLQHSSSAEFWAQ